MEQVIKLCQFTQAIAVLFITIYISSVLADSSKITDTDSQIIQTNQPQIHFKNLKAKESESFQPIQGGLMIGVTSPNNRVFISDSNTKNREVRLSEKGEFLVGIGRDETKVQVQVITPLKSKTIQSLKITPRSYKIERVNGLPPSKVTPMGEAAKKRIARESSLVRKARKVDSSDANFLDGFIWPVKGRISGVYGSQRVLNGKPRRPHYGVDIARPTGTVVSAPAAGTVILAEKDLYFSGGTLMIDHGYGLSSSFLHLSEINVELGEEVTQGEPIAKIGSTGRASGPHLDWRMNWFNVRIDPQLLVEQMPQ